MNNITELVFILDRSGSMAGLESDTIGGAIHPISNIHKYARPEDVPAHTLFGITTGGMENASYHCDSRGTALNYQAINEAVCCVRMAQPLTAAWKNCVEDDFENREGR